MKRFVMTLLVLGVVVGAVAMLMKRRSADEWHFGKDAAEPAADTDSEAAS